MATNDNDNEQSVGVGKGIMEGSGSHPPEEMQDTGNGNDNTTETNFKTGLEKFLSLESRRPQNCMIRNSIDSCFKIYKLLEDPPSWESTFSQLPVRVLEDIAKQRRFKKMLREWLIMDQMQGSRFLNSLGDERLGVLHYAAVLGYTWAIHPILIAGGCINLEDPMGRTAVDCASFEGRSIMVEMLKSCGGLPGTKWKPIRCPPERTDVLPQVTAARSSESRPPGVFNFLNGYHQIGLGFERFLSLDSRPQNCTIKNSIDLCFKIYKLLEDPPRWENILFSGLLGNAIYEDPPQWPDTPFSVLGNAICEDPPQGPDTLFSGLPENVKSLLNIQWHFKKMLREWLITGIMEGWMSLNELGNDGLGLVHYLAALGYTWAIRPLLLIDGVRIDLKDANGRTALDWALSMGRNDTVEFLKIVVGRPEMKRKLTRKYPPVSKNVGTALAWDRIYSEDFHVRTIHDRALSEGRNDLVKMIKDYYGGRLGSKMDHAPLLIYPPKIGTDQPIRTVKVEVQKGEDEDEGKDKTRKKARG